MTATIVTVGVVTVVSESVVVFASVASLVGTV